MSFDAYTLANIRLSPENAYQYARGHAIRHPLGGRIRLKGPPLDFLAVTDHSEYLGVLRSMADPSSELSAHPLSGMLTSQDPGQHDDAVKQIFSAFEAGRYIPGLGAIRPRQSAWQEIVDAAQRNYQPGAFTTFIAYEYSAVRDGHVLHRNVIFKGSHVPGLPFSSLESQNPADLWSWMESNRRRHIDALAIPHNTNESRGDAFGGLDALGRPIDQAYAKLRQRNEPVVEIAQMKGTSEIRPGLAPNDEWSNFEILDAYAGAEPVKSGSFVRTGLLMTVRLPADDLEKSTISS